MGLVTDVVSMKASSATTANGDTTAVDLSAYTQCLFTINVTAIGGTPNMVVKLQFTDDNGTTWYDFDPKWYVGTTDWAAFTGTAKQSRLVACEPMMGVRIDYVITGTTPSLTWYANCIGVKAPAPY